MSDGVQVRIEGLAALKTALLGLPDKLRRRALRNALAAGARLVRDDARRRAPVVQPKWRAPHRKPGTVRDALVVRTSKLARRRGDVGVFVNVRPAKKGQRGAKNRNDPFYWRFLEFGTRRMAARPFLQGAAQKLGEALQLIVQRLGPQIEKLNRQKDL